MRARRFARISVRPESIPNGWEWDAVNMRLAPCGTAEQGPPAPQQWPLWARGVRLNAKPPDRGVGDTIERTVGRVGGRLFKKWSNAVGFNCGCIARRDKLNRQYPYQ